MILEICGLGFVNRGAELMLRAICDHFAPWDKTVQLATSLPIGTFSQRAELKLLQKVPARWSSRLALASRILSASVRRTCGLVEEPEIAAVLDASGFAYSDQFGPGPCETLARNVRRWRTQHKKIVLLPQALGPFTKLRVRDAFRQALEDIDLVFARDNESMAHMRELMSNDIRVRHAPDFTCLVPGSVPREFESLHNMAAIVPNIRMIDKTKDADGRQYVRLLSLCVETLLQRHIEIVAIIHAEEQDGAVLDRVEAETGCHFLRIQDCSGLETKGILGKCRLVVASRYHALVNGLSQTVPCIGTGWSHKYQTLFSDFGCPDLLLSVNASRQRIQDALGQAIDEPSRSQTIAQLAQAAQILRGHVAAMWNEIDGLLGLTANPSHIQ